MAFCGRADGPEGLRERAARGLVAAMGADPEGVAGEGGACTKLMGGKGGRVAVKTGGEAVFTAILPDLKRGIAVKIMDLFACMDCGDSDPPLLSICAISENSVLLAFIDCISVVYISLPQILRDKETSDAPSDRMQ